MQIKLAEVLQRELRGRELKALAKELEIPLSNLHSWLNGVPPSGKSFVSLIKLADYLNLTLDEMILNRKSVSSESQIISSTTFRDGRSTYRVSVERV